MQHFFFVISLILSFKYNLKPNQRYVHIGTLDTVWKIDKKQNKQTDRKPIKRLRMRYAENYCGHLWNGNSTVKKWTWPTQSISWPLFTSSSPSSRFLPSLAILPNSSDSLEVFSSFVARHVMYLKSIHTSQGSDYDCLSWESNSKFLFH